MVQGNPHLKVVFDSSPKVASQLTSLWGTADFNPYLDSLLQEDKRPGRLGFAEDVFSALLALGAQHDQEFPELKPRSPWIS